MGIMTHGMTNTPIYRQWAAMLDRMRPTSRCYRNYGGRGISVCDAWRQFENFYADMGAEWRSGLTLDRWPDPNGNYEPGNCRWATGKQQALNTRRTNDIDTPWGRMPLGAAAELTGINRATISSRIKAGTNPFIKRNIKPRAFKTIDTPYGALTIADAARRAGLEETTVRSRAQRGTPPDEILLSPREMRRAGARRRNSKHEGSHGL